MNSIKTFDDMYRRAADSGRRARIAAVRPDDEATQAALDQIATQGLADIIRIDDPVPEQAAQQAVELIRHGDADVLMKGLIGTDVVLRAVLNKEYGLLPEGRVLTHLAAAEIPSYHKMLLFTDAAVIPYPTHQQRLEQVRYAVDVCHHMGMAEPRVALIHCAEHGGKQFPFVDEYPDIKQRAAKGEFGPCIVDGPLDVKSACSLQALRTKGIDSPLQGESDVLVLPDIEAGNAFYKTLGIFANSRTAGMLCGTTVPVVVPSRGDDSEAKYNSILFALASL